MHGALVPGTRLLLLRHGQSVQNVLLHARVPRDRWPAAFQNTHSSLLPLTRLGRTQAQIAGEWINARYSFDEYISSEFIRARQTAALLGLTQARWHTEPLFAETGWGRYDDGVEPTDEELEQITGAHGWWHSTQTVERGVDQLVRIDVGLRSVAERAGQGSAVIVSHGGVIQRMRMRIEQMSIAQFAEMTRDPVQRISNCDAVEYDTSDPRELRMRIVTQAMMRGDEPEARWQVVATGRTSETLLHEGMPHWLSPWQSE